MDKRKNAYFKRVDLDSRDPSAVFFARAVQKFGIITLTAFQARCLEYGIDPRTVRKIVRAGKDTEDTAQWGSIKRIAEALGCRIEIKLVECAPKKKSVNVGGVDYE